VLDQQQRHAGLAQSRDQSDDGMRLVCHHARGRLVEDQQFWLERQRAGDLDDVLTDKHIAADNPLGLFVGIPAYEAAGGAVLRDLFDEENSGWLTDAALVNRLAAEKLEESAAAVRGEGWKWVEIMPVLSWETLNVFDRARPEYSDPTEEQYREIEVLTDEGNAIIDDAALVAIGQLAGQAEAVGADADPVEQRLRLLQAAARSARWRGVAKTASRMPARPRYIAVTDIFCNQSGIAPPWRPVAPSPAGRKAQGVARLERDPRLRGDFLDAAAAALDPGAPARPEWPPNSPRAR
jgi:hypothetical protein